MPASGQTITTVRAERRKAHPVPVAVVSELLGGDDPTAVTAVSTPTTVRALYFPAIFISGAIYPREAQPEFAQRIGDFLPLTCAVEAIKQAWTTGTVHWPAVGILAGVTVLAAAVAVRTFRWESR
jgi:ABC-type multidrug transport system permease subunit